MPMGKPSTVPMASPPTKPAVKSSSLPGAAGQDDAVYPHPTHQKRYGLVQFDTFSMAKAKLAHLTELCTGVDQLNVVIKEEGSMDDPELLAVHPKVKVFAGAAWYLIHERRWAEGWYGSLQE